MASCDPFALNQHSAPLPQRKSRVNAKFVASIRRREPTRKNQCQRKPRRHTQKSVAKEALGVEASASAASGGTGAKGRKKQEPKSFLRGIDSYQRVMLKQLLRNDQDTRTLCGVVFDTLRLKPAERSGGGKGTNAGLQRRSATEGPWSRSWTTVHLGVGWSGPRTHHRRNEAW